MNKQNCIGKLKTAHDSLEEVITSVSLEVESQLNTTAASQTKLTEADKMLQKLQKELQHATETLMAVIGSVCADEKVYLASSTEKLVTEVVARATPKVRVKHTPAVIPSNVFTLEQLKQMGNKTLYSKPQAITLPTGKVVAVKNWTDVVTTMVSWISGKNKLPSMPFQGTSNARYKWFLNKTGVHSNGQAMYKCKVLNLRNKDVYVDVNRNSPDIISQVNSLCLATKVWPSSIKIELAPTVVKI